MIIKNIGLKIFYVQKHLQILINKKQISTSILDFILQWWGPIE
jgi:hypothetical protein